MSEALPKHLPQLQFPRLFDSTMLTTLDACEKKFYYEYILKLSPLAISPDLHAGGAFSLGCEVVRHCYFVEHMAVEQCLTKGHRSMIEYWGAFNPPHGHVKTLEAMLAALTFYFTEAFPLATDHITPYMISDRQAAVEFNFSMPTEVMHPETGDPILFGGRCDMLGVFQKSLMCILDDKTTKRLGDYWAKQWAMRGQFMGYSYAAIEHGYPVELCVIRGISILKNSFGHLEVIEQFPKWQLLRWWENVNKKLRVAVDKYKSGEWTYSYGEACAAWGQCQYIGMCLSTNPSELFSNYQERTWDPLKKNPTEPVGGMANITYENVGNIYESE